jgi:hypothetical protein
MAVPHSTVFWQQPYLLWFTAEDFESDTAREYSFFIPPWRNKYLETYYFLAKKQENNM